MAQKGLRGVVAVALNTDIPDELITDPERKRRQKYTNKKYHSGLHLTHQKWYSFLFAYMYPHTGLPAQRTDLPEIIQIQGTETTVLPLTDIHQHQSAHPAQVKETDRLLPVDGKRNFPPGRNMLSPQNFPPNKKKLLPSVR